MPAYKFLDEEIYINEDLLKAIINGNLQQVTSIVQDKDINLQTPLSDTGLNYLHVAVYEGAAPDMITYLHNQGVNVNGVYKAIHFGYITPIGLYTVYGIKFRLDSIQALLDCGALAEPPTLEIFKKVVSILEWSVDRFELFKLCHSKNKEVISAARNKSLWFSAVRKPSINLPIIKYLAAECGFDVNTLEDKYNHNALFFAAGNNTPTGVATVEFLLSMKANPNVRTEISRNSMVSEHSTALINTIQTDNLPAFLKLINDQDTNLTLESPLCWLAVFGRIEMLKAYVAKKVRLDQKIKGKNALQCAVDSQESETKSKLATIVYLDNLMDSEATPRYQRSPSPSYYIS